MLQLSLLCHWIQVWEVADKQRRLNSNRTRMRHASWRSRSYLAPPFQNWITSVVFGFRELHEFAVQNYAQVLQLPQINDLTPLSTHCSCCLSCCKCSILHSCQALLNILGFREKLRDKVLTLSPVSLGSKHFSFGAINRHALRRNISPDDFCYIIWFNLISRILVEMIKIIRNWLAISSIRNCRFQYYWWLWLL